MIQFPRMIRAALVAVLLLLLGLTACGADDSDREMREPDREAAYLKAVKDNNPYLLISWGDPSESELLAVGYETCTSLIETDGLGGGIGTLDVTLARLGLDRGSLEAEMYAYTADEAVNELCED